MTQKTILVTGGAGYLGGSMCFVLERNGYRPIVLDNFSTSRRPKAFPFPLHEVDLTDWDALERLRPQLGAVAGVIHFAARALVSESCEKPDLYFRNNLLATLNMARLCVENGIANFLHSSSCAVYGQPKQVPIRETTDRAPISPYGETKRAAEDILRHIAANKPVKVINLRYFNPCGAVFDGIWGEAHEPETHLFPNVLRAALRDEPVSVFGEDYETPDGTCIRDFIHVEDLMSAHLAALRHLDTLPPSSCREINVGSGTGYSVRQVIAAVEKVTGKSLRVNRHPRRPGDPPALIADTTLVRSALGWQPTRTLEDMVRSHLRWEENRAKLA